MHCFTYFPYKNIRDQIWPCCKISQGQPRVIIWTNLVVLEHPILHTKFQGHRPFCSGEEDFLRFLPHMGMAAILVMWPEPFEQTFVPLSQVGSLWNLASIGPVVSEEKMFENVDIHTPTHTYGWQRPTYTIKLTDELKILTFECGIKSPAVTRQWGDDAEVKTWHLHPAIPVPVGAGLTRDWCIWVEHSTENFFFRS